MPFNSAAHEFLTANGYSYQHFNDEVSDSGYAETGPMVVYHPAYDEYKSDEDYVRILEDGTAHFEFRDAAFENWVENQIN